MEDESLKSSSVSTLNRNSHSDGKHGRSTKTVLKLPFWFRFLLKIPELKAGTNAFMGLVYYCFAPMLIIFGYVVAFTLILVYMAFPYNVGLITVILMPLITFSASAKAHVAYNFYKTFFVNDQEIDREKALKEYLELIRKNNEAP